MSIFICELCGHEIKINLKNKDPKDIVCSICHRNGKIEDGIWVPTLKEKVEKNG